MADIFTYDHKELLVILFNHVANFLLLLLLLLILSLFQATYLRAAKVNHIGESEVRYL